MLDMEEQLQSPQFTPVPSEMIISADRQNGRTTRGVNISTKYKGLMSKNRREEVERETLQEANKPIVMEKEVLLYLHLLSNHNSSF